MCDGYTTTVGIELSPSTSIGSLLTLSRNAEAVARMLDALIESARKLAEKTEEARREAEAFAAALRITLRALSSE